MGLADLADKGCRVGGRILGAFCLVLLVVCSTFSSLGNAADAPLVAKGYKMAGDATKMRIVMEFDREPDIKWFLLRGPNRLVIDLANTKLAIDAKDLKPRGLVRGVRLGELGDGVSRLILTGKGPFAVDRLDVLKDEDGTGYRIAIDMSAASAREFDAALANQALTTGSTVSTDKGGRVGTGPVSNPGHRFTVVIDPGHGGVDGGAEGLNGTIEKDVTLAFATELRDKLAAAGKYDVFMTRDTDEYLRLDDRVRIARQHEADLLISIHADTISVKGIRGATVYTVSDKASDPEAQALADRENLSDQFAGMVIKDDKKEVTDILIDLIRRETHTFSMSFAHTLVGQLSTSVGLINNPQRSAGFKVLKAPDVPSVLVELGYLSNAKDEAQLLDADWRDKAAQSITNAVALFASARAGAGTGG
ncbi:N-acetylmuramoyl-L-alanine amidase [Mesorhizobium opportunistum]|uniref:N-acetylmuramoyl-L-alanine amidase n=1 Tax=Mesorhizobium opportunistum TaxID=593909 RepID=A0ABV1Y9F3_9HYPH|nr:MULTISPECIES: N-acetylmuramoyl-L-alanine amidase [Mesorhizobium]ESY69645.1 N-acetylmuramoyl-L-alanine amidase [Mesorhizobium sp. LNHC232B00]TIN91392.1 MAG: N-acetylmuramoyl-L-alanine amidase [Mesorhizobium sp.]TJV01385.1 MAG: N-acetylmuramoyl-L-alanine amidase [Mesorhizobium sp.]TJV19995.1 MAG: N-acetylmuramoyl-L-alanine amidase [Mesorhizobium sp.]WJI40346.1 N-acetylmuramoyl-L-alanine amidase [Mesorhizobium opportunistum]